ncbi:uncharacterized protein F4807DRAFT_122660 [Annulohypoxylon truncatum]|uniref:uncharacterized protein n=1 Tax=Annulohypoxylon truncatum TaxID=327061 RepID=UPI00200758CD|nr:uncharacterized protein F4807DRAFT_122660 [Annulohypoxylon truncatum]KAI1214339.1 hypothetical protein F4807DRAFT_122660 [Annulohypoxylon truncatum]
MVPFRFQDRIPSDTHRHYPRQSIGIINHNEMSTKSTSPLRLLFLTEGVMKLAGGLVFMISPQTPLSVAVAAPIPPSALLLTRLLGTQTFTLGISMLLASTRTSKAVSSRRIVYWTIFARDATLVTVLALQLLFGQNSDALGFSVKGLRACLAELMPFCLGHLWILAAKPHWF